MQDLSLGSLSLHQKKPVTRGPQAGDARMQITVMGPEVRAASPTGTLLILKVFEKLLMNAMSKQKSIFWYIKGI